jgi:hypothetical protein
VAHLSTGSEKDFSASLENMARTVPKKERKAFNRAGTYFNAVYFGAHAKPDAGLPDWHAVEGMTRTQFEHFVAQIQQSSGPAKSVSTAKGKPRWALTQSYLDSLQMEVSVLEHKRKKAHEHRHYTIDQFKWAQPAFQPPRWMDGLLDSRAVFHMNFTNRTHFDVYPPTLHLTITVPDRAMPLYDEDLNLDMGGGKTDEDGRLKFVTESLGAAIAPDTPTLLTYTCCDLIAHPNANTLMRHLPDKAQFHYTITGVKDYTKQDQLDHEIFAAYQWDELKRAKACIADIKSRVKKWTVDTAVHACRERSAH